MYLSYLTVFIVSSTIPCMFIYVVLMPLVRNYKINSHENERTDIEVSRSVQIFEWLCCLNIKNHHHHHH